ncbi:MAG TPA: hypothetical protein VGR03_14515 [Candidatus Acidoferrum sp.]|nr:hypothetical protein [Candidatus Acidoferrum sp.]
MGNGEPIDYAAIIADIEAKITALTNTLAAFRAAHAAGALGLSGDGIVPTTTAPFSASGGEVPVGAFLGRSIPEAAKLCLQIVKRKLTSREIADYLKKGGIETSAKSFPALVHSILIRASKPLDSPIVKLDRSYWGLAEWYPTGMRSSGNTDKRIEKRGRKRRRGRPAKSEDGPKLLSGPTPTSRIKEVLKSKPGVEFSAQEIAAPANVSLQVANLTLGRLVASKQAERTHAGKYRAVGSIN